MRQFIRSFASAAAILCSIQAAEVKLVPALKPLEHLPGTWTGVLTAETGVSETAKAIIEAAAVGPEGANCLYARFIRNDSQDKAFQLRVWYVEPETGCIGSELMDERGGKVKLLAFKEQEGGELKSSVDVFARGGERGTYIERLKWIDADHFELQATENRFEGKPGPSYRISFSRGTSNTSEIDVAKGQGEVVIGTKHTFHSELLKEDKTYYIHLPPSYQESIYQPRRYPVIYLLAGDNHFTPITGVLELARSFPDLLPETILVGIGDTDDIRDFTPTHSNKGFSGREDPAVSRSGGGGAFHSFLKDELIPRIESQYRTAPFRIIAGAGIGGLFALNTLPEKPKLFDAVIAMHPTVWWDDYYLSNRFSKVFELGESVSGIVFISRAKTGGKTQERNDPKTIADLLQAHQNEKLRAGFRDFPDDGWTSFLLPSAHHALRYIFEGYQMPPSLYSNPTASGVREHYAALSRRLGYDFLPPEEKINDWAYSLLNNPEKIDNAVDLFRLNIELYPRSWNAYDSLAEALDKKGDLDNAKRNYERSLELNPKNSHAQNWLSTHQ